MSSKIASGPTEALPDEVKKRRIDMLEKQMQSWVDDFKRRYNQLE